MYPKLLADPDSCFCEFQGVQIYHKLYNAESHSSDNSLFIHSQDAKDQTQTPSLKLGLPMILLHGFGASVFSWNTVMKRLAHLTGCTSLISWLLKRQFWWGMHLSHLCFLALYGYIRAKASLLQIRSLCLLKMYY